MSTEWMMVSRKSEYELWTSKYIFTTWKEWRSWWQRSEKIQRKIEDVVINNLHTFSIRNRLYVPSSMNRFLGTRTHFLRVSTFFFAQDSVPFFMSPLENFVNWNWWDDDVVHETGIDFLVDVFRNGYTHQNYLNKLNRIFFRVASSLLARSFSISKGYENIESVQRSWQRVVACLGFESSNQNHNSSFRLIHHRNRIKPSWLVFVFIYVIFLPSLLQTMDRYEKIVDAQLNWESKSKTSKHTQTHTATSMASGVLGSGKLQ